MSKEQSAPSWAFLMDVTSQEEALVVLSLLKGAGIQARLAGETVGQLYGFSTGPLGKRQIEVNSKQLELAQDLLAADYENSEEFEPEDPRS